MMGGLCCLVIDRVSGVRRPRRGLERSSIAAEDRPKRRVPYHLIGHLVASAYIIAMLELIIKRNNLGPGAGLWTFGQVLAMMMLIGPLIDLLSLIFGNVDGESEAEEASEP
jgi:hypothetical protein